MKVKQWICLMCLFAMGAVAAHAQTMRIPLDIPIYLSGNFGELRNNHFHSGIDFKTQGAEGKAVHAVKDGYICRISVSPWGYGNALYINHPDGTTTVYGHLRNFTEKVAEYVKSKQYEQETFALELELDPNQFPVKYGDIIAYSGNTGGSAGPHLHFEVRNTQTEEPMDALVYYKDKIKDTRPPKFRAVMIYPKEGEGVVNGSRQKRRLKLVTAKNGTQSIGEKIEAWGKISFGINIDDYMNGTSNVYGVKEITMTVDDRELFHSYQDQFAFDETRYINSWTDFETWRDKRSFFTKTFVEPGNRLRFMTSKNRGYLMIDEAKTYQVVFQLTDAYGNTSKLELNVVGRKQNILPPDTAGTTHFFWNAENRYGASGIRLFVERGNLYDDFFFRHSSQQNGAYLSDIHTVHDTPVPLHQSAHLSLHLLRDSLINKKQYGIVALGGKNKTWIGGTYRDGWIDADITEFGKRYAVDADTVPPKITPIDPTLWSKKETITFRLTDNLSDVDSYRGEIDGAYALFEMDGKKSIVHYYFDSQHLKRGKHTLKMIAADGCGNQSLYESTFNW